MKKVILVLIMVVQFFGVVNAAPKLDVGMLVASKHSLVRPLCELEGVDEGICGESKGWNEFTPGVAVSYGDRIGIYGVIYYNSVAGRARELDRYNNVPHSDFSKGVGVYFKTPSHGTKVMIGGVQGYLDNKWLPQAAIETQVTDHISVVNSVGAAMAYNADDTVVTVGVVSTVMVKF